ncbi:short-chain dehydrogenase [Halobacillus mangrovi]|uniref:short-chain dehydrogenase n=1 Tax=Halobacillus mangrovi TaxID=402384 RepID=UPI003D99E766
MKHALIIGGTGMLSDCCVQLAKQGYQLSIVARNEEKMDRIKKKIDPVSKMTKLLVDYTEEDKLQTAIRKAIQIHGPVSLVVSWIHSTAPKAAQVLIDEVALSEKPFRFFHILGSSSDPIAYKESLSLPSQGHYRTVLLGFVKEKGGSRWLTHSEISNGVAEAIEQDEPFCTVGEVEPWEERPGF